MLFLDVAYEQGPESPFLYYTVEPPKMPCLAGRLYERLDHIVAKFQTFSSKSGRGRLQEVATYHRL